MSKQRPLLDKLEKSLKALEANPDAIKIKALRFPNYRTLEKDARLPFNFPITVLLGSNGTNKSAILHALYGSTKGATIADFWFETDLDAIPPRRFDRKQSVVHLYEDEHGCRYECIKARAPRSKADPDYWEPVKPTGRYGFAPGATRVAPIDLTSVIHLDFRGELPAFDKYFYFPDPQHLQQRADYARKRGALRREYRKQDYLRQRSRLVKKKMEMDGTTLSPTEIDILKYILERDYESGKILEHSLFHGHQGRTILFRTPEVDGGYSDAFAGSGESAAALLVHNIVSAPNGALVLFDEPETSLHPRAQQRMMQFLAHYAVRKSLQIVMATHSIYLAEKLPQHAIRVLVRTRDGCVHISTSHSAREALHEVGDVLHGKTLLVEDQRAKHIVLSALEATPAHPERDIQVVVRDGGTSRIFSDLVAHANSRRMEVFVLFDGDHQPSKSLPAELPRSPTELKRLISEYTKGPNTKGPSLDFVDDDEMVRYIEFLRSNVRFLPGSTPEQLIWSEHGVARLLGVSSVPQQILDERDGKRRLELVAEQAAGLDADSVFKFLLAEFLKSTTGDAEELRHTLNEIRSA